MRFTAHVLVLGLAFTVSGTAPAATITRTQVQNATGVCQAALPNYEGNVRKRPLGLNNEGTAAAFVSCSFKADSFYDETGNTFNGLQLSNTGATAVEVSCSLVAGGTLPVRAAVYFPKTFPVPAGASVVAGWDPTLDNEGEPFPSTLNWSCNLPPGVNINVAFTNITEEVGAL